MNVTNKDIHYPTSLKHSGIYIYIYIYTLYIFENVFYTLKETARLKKCKYILMSLKNI